MNPADPPVETLRSLRSKPETRPARTREEEDAFEPRYVDVPRRRHAQATAASNLKWGLAVLLLALGLLGASLIVSGPRALVPVILCLVTFTILWAMARLRIFHQRNGVFFATAMVCLLGAGVPLIERGYIELDRMVHTPRPAAPVAASTEAAPEVAPQSEPPALVEAFRLKPPVDATRETVRIVEDTTVVVARKPYRLRVGDTFLLDDIKDGRVTFLANERPLSVPENIVEVLPGKRSEQPPAPAGAPAAVTAPPTPRVSDQEAPAEVTGRANAEAMRRYPAIGVKDSAENRLFIERVAEFKKDRPEFFSEPEWPLYLAEGLAKEQGWTSAVAKPPPPSPPSGDLLEP